MTVTIALVSNIDPKFVNEVSLRDANEIKAVQSDRIDENGKRDMKIMVQDNWTVLGSFFINDIRTIMIEFDKEEAENG